MAQNWHHADAWDDTTSTETDDRDATHACRVCDHGATIQTPQRRTEHFCRDCETWRRFVSVHNDP